MSILCVVLLTLSSFNFTPDLSHHPKGSESATLTMSGNRLGSPAHLEDSLTNLYYSIGLTRYNLPYEVFRYGMIGYYKLKQENKLSDKNLVSIIDFTKPSTEKRFYTIDLDRQEVVYYTYVSHGRNTGENIARSFSNEVHSNQSSLGFYVTGETYIGSKGYSLKLDGTEKGVNDKMRERAVVMHEAEYVSERWIKNYGRLGRSQGCPALPKEISREVINNIKNHTMIFAYYKDESYLQSSAYLNVNDVLPEPSQEMVQDVTKYAPATGEQLSAGILHSVAVPTWR
jgi:hypothetical protein